MKKILNKAFIIGLISVMSLLVFSACSTSTGNIDEKDRAAIGETAPESGSVDFSLDTGRIIIRVNPEIAVLYDKNGLVLSLVGLNPDGEAIVANYKDYVGKDCNVVINDLVIDINEAGYFVSDIDGSFRNITLQIEPNSVLPEQNFLESIAAEVTETTKTMQIAPKIQNIGAGDYESTFTPETSDSQYITKNKATEIAVNHAGVAVGDIQMIENESDFDDNRLIYELEFSCGGINYDYDIDARTGNVISYQCEDNNVLRGGSPYSGHHRRGMTNATYISSDEALTVALTHAGVNRADAVVEENDFDTDDGYALYEIEFISGSREYSYKIDAVTARILSFESDENDDYRAAASTGTTNVQNLTVDTGNVVSPEVAPEAAVETSAYGNNNGYYNSNNNNANSNYYGYVCPYSDHENHDEYCEYGQGCYHYKGNGGRGSGHHSGSGGRGRGHC